MQLELFEDNLRDTQWMGEVINNSDELFDGRIQVRVFGKFDDIPDEHLPWALPGNLITAGSGTGSGTHNVPKVGSIIRITFDNGQIYHPRWHYFHKISEELKSRIGTEELYENAQSITYDTEANFYCYFIPTEGFFIRTQSDDEFATELLITTEKDIVLKNFTESEATNSLRLNADNSFLLTTKDETNRVQIDAEDNITISNLETTNEIRIDNENNILIANALTGDTNSIQINADANIILTSSSGSIAELRADGSVFLTSSDGIIVHTNQGISLGSENSSAEPAVLGDTLETVINTIVEELGKVSAIITPTGPSGPLSSASTWSAFVAAVKAELPSFKSETVTLD